jgi:hypothetical protein
MYIQWFGNLSGCEINIPADGMSEAAGALLFSPTACSWRRFHKAKRAA